MKREDIKKAVENSVLYFHDDGMPYTYLLEDVIGDWTVCETLDFDDDEIPEIFFEVLNEVIKEGNYDVDMTR